MSARERLLAEVREELAGVRSSQKEASRRAALALLEGEVRPRATLFLQQAAASLRECTGALEAAEALLRVPEG